MLTGSNSPLLQTSKTYPVDVCLKDQPDAHRLGHQLTFEQFPVKQIEQTSFNDQLKEYRKKSKKSIYDQYKETRLTNSRRKKLHYLGHVAMITDNRTVRAIASIV